MSAARSSHPAHQQIAAALAWLRQHGPAAHLMPTRAASRRATCSLRMRSTGRQPRIHRRPSRGAAAVLYQPEGLVAAPAVPVALAVPALDQLAGEIASGWYGDPSDNLLAG